MTNKAASSIWAKTSQCSFAAERDSQRKAKNMEQKVNLIKVPEEISVREFFEMF